jgi:hypothetical protein
MVAFRHPSQAQTSKSTVNSVMNATIFIICEKIVNCTYELLSIGQGRVKPKTGLAMKLEMHLTQFKESDTMSS